MALGLRGFGQNTYDTKPPTNLINAWLAGVPFVGGRDSAFTDIATPDEEYLVADSPAQLESALTKLLKNERVGVDLRAAGTMKRAEFDVPAITRIWRQQLEEIIAVA